jgi:hypothetical protein
MIKVVPPAGPVRSGLAIDAPWLGRPLVRQHRKSAATSFDVVSTCWTQMRDTHSEIHQVVRWRSLGESNPRFSLERATSWTARRRERGCPR